MTNLIEGLMDELKRARKLLKDYKELPNNAGWFAIPLIEQAIKNGKDAIKEGDIIKELKSYEVLKDLK